MAIKIVEVELSQPVQAVTGLTGYEEVWLLVKLHRLPVGDVRLPVLVPQLEPEAIIEAIVTWIGWSVLAHLLQDNLLAQAGYAVNPEQDLISKISSGNPEDLTQLLKSNLKHGLATADFEPPCLQWRQQKATWFVTVAVCTRNGAARLATCLDALENLDYSRYEILIIDNAPQDDAVWQLLEKRNSPRCRYIVEPRPGVSWARNRAIQEAQGDIVAFTDDDARPDPLWLVSLVAGLQRPGVSLVAGRAYPLELENEVQVYCEKFGVRDRGFEPKIINLRTKGYLAHPYNSYTLGGSYNLAAWRETFQTINGFDTALGRGTPAGTASDADLIYRLLSKGYTIAYEPTALVKLTHPSDFNYVIKHNQLGSSGVFAFFTKCFEQEPQNRRYLLWYAFRMLVQVYLWGLLKQLTNGDRVKRRLQWAALKGALMGPRNYHKSVKLSQELAGRYSVKNPPA